MTVSKEVARDLVDELQPLLNEVFGRHGMAAPKVTWKYGAWFEVKAEGTLYERGDNGVNLNSPDAQYFTLFGFSDINGLKLSAPLGTKFKSRGVEYIFGGIAAKRRKYPIVGISTISGETTLFTEGMVGIINAAAMAAA